MGQWLCTPNAKGNKKRKEKERRPGTRGFGGEKREKGKKRNRQAIKKGFEEENGGRAKFFSTRTDASREKNSSKNKQKKIRDFTL